MCLFNQCFMKLIELRKFLQLWSNFDKNFRNYSPSERTIIFSFHKEETSKCSIKQRLFERFCLEIAEKYKEGRGGSQWIQKTTTALHASLCNIPWLMECINSLYYIYSRPTSAMYYMTSIVTCRLLVYALDKHPLLNSHGAVTN